MPTDEDIRDYPFPNLAESTNQQNIVTENFINSLSLDKTDKKEERLKPSSLFSPTLQYFYQCLCFRAENPQGPLPPLDPNIENYLRPDREMFDKAKQQCNEFANAFSLKEVQVVVKEKKFYADLLKGKPDNQPEEEKVDRISDLTPLEDFETMMNDRKTDRVSTAIKLMEDYILRLLDRDFKGNMHNKAIECLKTLRNGCIKEYETLAFNKFMIEKIKNLQKVHLEFWNLVVDERITLISANECNDSKVTLNEAKNFLVKIEPAKELSVALDLDDIE